MPRLSDFIRILLSAYRETGPPDDFAGCPPVLQALGGEQLGLGRDSLLNGFLVGAWRAALDGSTGRMRPVNWLKRLVVHIYELCGRLWGKRNELLSQQGGG
jgi:hypothetical protein